VKFRYARRKRLLPLFTVMIDTGHLNRAGYVLTQHLPSGFSSLRRECFVGHVVLH
jgi:hypothetical protein